MLRVLLFFVVVALAALGVIWLLDNPGSVRVEWLGHIVNVNIGIALAGLALLILAVLIVWSLLRSLFGAPGSISRSFARRRQKKSLATVRQGLLAVGAGDPARARSAAKKAQGLVPDEPLTLLLRAQSAQLAGDDAAAQAAFRAMLDAPDTRALGLRGLYVEALRQGDRRMAERLALEAAKTHKSLPWAGRALYEAQCRNGVWNDALETLQKLVDGKTIDRETGRRHRAALLTAEAVDLEADRPDEARQLADEAHKLAPDLVPAAVIAARQASRAGEVKKAARIAETTWVKEPHYELAEAYAHARAGDSAADRLDRVRRLAEMMTSSEEGPISVARAAIEAQDWRAARDALKPLIDGRPSRRDCLLMAHVEEMEHGDTAAAREWLSRALNARPDPAWVAGEIVSESWLPVSPATGEVDAFRWRRPADADPALLEGRSNFLSLTAARREVSAEDVRAEEARAKDVRAEVSPRPEPVGPVEDAVVADLAETSAAGTSARAKPGAKAGAEPAPAPAHKPAPATAS